MVVGWVALVPAPALSGSGGGDVECDRAVTPPTVTPATVTPATVTPATVTPATVTPPTVTADASDREARAALSFLADPGDLALGRLLRSLRPAQLLAALSAGGAERTELAAGHHAVPGLGRAVRRWRARLSLVPSAAQVAAWQNAGIRLVCPGEPEWPTQLDDLGDSRPILLWLRGSADLRYACLQSASVVGARAATSYGSYVASELAAALAERDWVVVSGGAYGIDASAHRGALAADGVTVAVLASGLRYGYPKGHHELFAAIAAQGVVVSEWPPDRGPSKPGFLVRNRVIAALSRGTVVVEAALRSGALSTARHARELCRPLMAVPGPITSTLSAGCHEIMREWGAVCVTGAHDVIELLSPVGEGLVAPRHGQTAPHDSLDPVTLQVFEALPARGGRGPAAIAVQAGVDLDTAIGCLGSLAAAGFAERADHGWRMRKTS
jgi:DNA processing protein